PPPPPPLLVLKPPFTAILPSPSNFFVRIMTLPPAPPPAGELSPFACTSPSSLSISLTSNIKHPPPLPPELFPLLPPPLPYSSGKYIVP
ncbi:predicted protein, partial [Nematostella vectensis]